MEYLLEVGKEKSYFTVPISVCSYTQIVPLSNHHLYTQSSSSFRNVISIHALYCDRIFVGIDSLLVDDKTTLKYDIAVIQLL